MNLIRVILTNGKPIANDKEVVLNTIQTCILKGKGEGGFILMKAELITYKEEGEPKNDRNDNKQDASRSLYP
jgi:hypothetical protein